MKARALTPPAPLFRKMEDGIVRGVVNMNDPDEVSRREAAEVEAGGGHTCLCGARVGALIISTSRHISTHIFVDYRHSNLRGGVCSAIPMLSQLVISPALHRILCGRSGGRQVRMCGCKLTCDMQQGQITLNNGVIMCMLVVEAFPMSSKAQ